jgi:uncharacterized membrane protein
LTAVLLVRTARRLFLALLPAGATVWLAALVLAPWAVTHQSTGAPVVRLAATAYLAGSLVCHQQPSRSFHLWNARLPVCARCSGLYAGGAGGLLIALLWQRRIRSRPRLDDRALRRYRWLVLAAAAPTVITWLLEHAGLLPAETANAARALAGLPLGGAVGWIVWVSLRSWSGPAT